MYFTHPLILHLSPRAWLGRRVRIGSIEHLHFPLKRERSLSSSAVTKARWIFCSPIYENTGKLPDTTNDDLEALTILTMVASKLPILLLLSLCSTSSIAYNLLDRPTLKVRKVNCPQYLLMCFFLYTYSYLTTAVWDSVEERKNRRPCCKSRKGWIPTHRHGMSATALQRGRGRRRLGCGCTGVKPR